MGLSIVTLALAKKYADAVAAAGSTEALDKTIKEAVRQSKIYTDEALSNITSFKVQIVESLPLSDIDEHTIYFLKRTKPSGEMDFYYEYMYINNQWELIGSTKLDLTGYWTIEQTKAYIASKEYILPRATTTTLGGVKVDGETIAVNNEGAISVVQKHTEETAANIAQSVIDENFDRMTESDISHLFD